MGLGPQCKLKKTVGDVDKVSSIYGSRVGRAWIQILALRFIGTVILGNLQSANYFFFICEKSNNNSYLRGFSPGQNNTGRESSTQKTLNEHLNKKANEYSATKIHWNH